MAPYSESCTRFLYIYNTVSLLLHCRTCMHAHERDNENKFRLFQFQRTTCRQKCYSCSFYRSNVDKIKLHNLHIQKTSTFIVQLLYTTQQRDPITIPAEQRHLYAYEIRVINPQKPELNPICYLLALLGAHHFLHVSTIRIKLLTFRLLMSYIYIWSNHS